MSDPSDVPAAGSEQPTPKAFNFATAEDRSQRRREMAGLLDDTNRARHWVLAAFCMQLVFGLIAGLIGSSTGQSELAGIARLKADDVVLRSGQEWSVADYRDLLATEQILCFLLPCAVAGIFMLLYLWARKAPIPALTTALLLFLVGHVLEALVIATPTLLLVAKILFAFALVKGISSAMVRRSLLAVQDRA